MARATASYGHGCDLLAFAPGRSDLLGVRGRGAMGDEISSNLRAKGQVHPDQCLHLAEPDVRPRNRWSGFDPIRTRDVQCNRPVPPLTDIREIGILQSPSQAGGEAHAIRSSETARVHHAARRCGRMVSRGAARSSPSACVASACSWACRNPQEQMRGMARSSFRHGCDTRAREMPKRTSGIGLLDPPHNLKVVGLNERRSGVCRPGGNKRHNGLNRHAKYVEGRAISFDAVLYTITELGRQGAESRTLMGHKCHDGSRFDRYCQSSLL
jgi:hypothetical protein